MASRLMRHGRFPYPRFASVIGKWGGCWIPPIIMLVLASSGYAKGLDPDRNNQIIICTDAPVDRPYFTLVFTSKPLARTIPLRDNRITRAQLTRLSKSKESVVLVVGGKESRKDQSCYDFFFGKGEDSNQPWNSGYDFHWQWWALHSDEVWDNLAIIYGVSDGKPAPPVAITVTDVAVRRGGMLLFDSRKTRSHPNLNPIDVRIAPVKLENARGLYSVRDLGYAMKKFKRLYYELDNNPVLLAAYDDLGQTDYSKYSSSPDWCSEFAIYIYRKSGISVPDSAGGELNWRAIKKYFSEKGGEIYGLREVVLWSQREREARIRPGSLFSIVTDKNTTHIFLLTNWVKSDANGMFSAISGNNRDMVWDHEPVSLEQFGEERLRRRVPAVELGSFYERSFVVVPVGLPP